MFQIEKIVFATDLTEATSSLASLVKDLIRLFEAELHVISILMEPVPDDVLGHDLLEITNFNEYQRELESTFEARLKDFVEREFNSIHGIQQRMLRGEPATAILRYAQQNHIDLIIMGSVTKPGWAGKLFGGTATKVVAQAPCPVMTINPFKSATV